MLRVIIVALNHLYYSLSDTIHDVPVERGAVHGDVEVQGNQGVRRSDRARKPSIWVGPVAK